MPPLSRNELLTNFKENLFSFILKCREKKSHSTDRPAGNSEWHHFLFCYFKENYDSFITCHLQKNGFNVLEYPEIRETDLYSQGIFLKKLPKLLALHTLKEHCKSKLSLVEPVHHILRSPSGHKIDTYSYVPITDVLSNYCSWGHIWWNSGKQLSRQRSRLFKWLHRWYMFQGTFLL